MSEVGSTQVPGVTFERSVTPVRNAPVVEHGKSGNKLPEQPATAGVAGGQTDAEAEQAETKQTVEAALESVNGFVQSIDRKLHFSVDEELETTIIKVIDSGSGDVIRQIPEDIFLELARNLKNDGELHLINALS